MKNLKKPSAILLVLALLVTMVPTTVFATASLTDKTVSMNVDDSYTLPYTDTSNYKCSIGNSTIAILNGFTIIAKKVGNTTVEVEKKKEYKAFGVVIWTEWKPEADYQVSVNGDVTVSYDVNGGNIPSTAMSETLYCLGSGQSYPVNNSFTAIRDRDDHYTYTFKGWSTDNKATKASTVVTIKGNTTLYAVWEKVNNVALADCYDSKGNFLESKRIVLAADGTEVSMASAAPQIDGKVFSYANVTVDLDLLGDITYKVGSLKLYDYGITKGKLFSCYAIMGPLKTWFPIFGERINCYYTDAQLADYTITATAETLNGKVIGEISSPGAVTVQEKSTPTYTITPNTGYQVADVKVDGASVGNMTSYTFEPVQRDHTITVTFEAIPYTVTYDLAGGIVAVENPTSYTVEDHFTLNNPAKAGHEFAGWIGTGLDEASTAVTVAEGSTGARAYTATWTENMNLTAEDVVVTYDGETHSIQVVGAPEGATIEYSEDENDISGTNPIYIDVTPEAKTVYYKVTKDGYTTTTGSAIVNISPAALTITADSATKRYDGTALTDSGWEDTAPGGLADDDAILYVQVTGSAVNVGTVSNSAIYAVIGRPNGDQPEISEEILADLRKEIAEAIAGYNEEDSNPPAVYMAAISEQNPLDLIIENIIGQYYQNVTSNYDITYVDGLLTITSSSSGHHNRNNSSTTIQDENVPLAGTPELNKVDHFNYMNGYQDGTIKPLNYITREEVASIFYRLLTDSSRQIFFTQDEDFSDINADRWSVDAIATLVNGGILTGNSDGTFGASKPITRAEFAVIASRFDTLEEDTDGINFSDISGNWAEKYIKSAVKKGWITGYSDETFKPNQYITRAEAMVLINRVLDRRVDEAGLVDGYKVFSDNNPTDWFYYQVIEATNNHNYAERASISDMETWTKIIEDKTWN
ncbi:S-layer homology domain-containing protein [Clostridium aminobutyricum]|uniref:S-layer homology domain-containing protein n=1 Tax=Clostridium aminobutyricum TaxID=33953 RepID=A0A939IKG9_CLOAM|nr:S-layer homology domain-containing protein [Clostridium aminobutyricum]MBN7774599.1 S-layer homology domain-containing protein [Clostridium aminobutyricum]